MSKELNINEKEKSVFHLKTKTLSDGVYIVRLSGISIDVYQQFLVEDY